MSESVDICPSLDSFEDSPHCKAKPLVLATIIRMHPMEESRKNGESLSQKHPNCSACTAALVSQKKPRSLVKIVIQSGVRYSEDSRLASLVLMDLTEKKAEISP